MNCKLCHSKSIRKGVRNHVQKWYCKACRKYFQSLYTYRKCTAEDGVVIMKLNNIGVGISGISHFTGISKANVINKIRQLASDIERPAVHESQQEYEVDEMHTFIKSKARPCYVIYALDKATKNVVDLLLGAGAKRLSAK